MKKNEEMTTISANFAVSYERYIMGYREYKISRKQQSNEEGERYDYSTRAEQAQR